MTPKTEWNDLVATKRRLDELEEKAAFQRQAIQKLVQSKVDATRERRLLLLTEQMIERTRIHANYLESRVDRPTPSETTSIYMELAGICFNQANCMPKGEAAELAVPLHGGTEPAHLRIRGRMDRLDLRCEFKDGKPLVTGLRILDYKLSQSDYKEKCAAEAMSALVSAQLPVYLCAAVEHLRTLEDAGEIALDLPRIWSESRAGYYVLRETPQARRRGRLPLLEVHEWPLQNDLEAFLDLDAADGSGGFFALLREKFESALRGRFEVHPLACAGTHCPARRTCRFQAIPSSAVELFQES